MEFRKIDPWRPLGHERHGGLFQPLFEVGDRVAADIFAGAALEADAPFLATAHYLCSPGLPGVDVMIIIFNDFCQYSAKKLAFFSKTNVMIKNLHNLA
jgi:hypothetical protein